MTFRFAAARTAARSPVARALTRRSPGAPANDNGDWNENNGHLRAALQHFAQHGLGAAAEARRQAENAFFEGNRERYDHWLGICRTLDQRMADTVALKRQG